MIYNSTCVLVHPACCNEVSQTGRFINRSLFPQFWRMESRITVSARAVSGEGPLSGCTLLNSCFVLIESKETIGSLIASFFLGGGRSDRDGERTLGS